MIRIYGLAIAAKRKFLCLTISLALMGWVSIANAGIIYNVDRIVGSGSVNGFIETDGTIGELTETNITDYFLVLTSSNLAGGSPFILDKANELETSIDGGGLSASLTDLFFDFSVLSSHFYFQSNLGQIPFYGLGTGGVCPGCIGEFIGWAPGFDGPAEQSNREGIVYFASSVNNVPEPSIIALLVLGLLGVGLNRRNHKTRI